MCFLLQKLSRRIQANILISIVLCYLAGALLVRWLDIGPHMLNYLTITALLLLVVLFIIRRNTNALLYTLPFFVLAGLIHTGYGLLPPRSPGHVYNQVQERTRATLTGNVARMPEFDGIKTRFLLDADSILFHDRDTASRQQVMTSGRIRLSFPGQFDQHVRPGDQLLILARVNRISNYKTPGVFDYRLFLASRSVFIAGTIESPSHILPFHDQTTAWYKTVRYFPERIRNNIGIFLDRNLSPEPAGLYRALLIGSRSDISDTVLEQYKATGCLHLLAISGVHMGLLGMIITVGTAWLMKRSKYLLLNTHIQTVATLVTLVPLTGYAFIAGLGTPVIRALIMAVFFLTAVVLRRQKSILHIIAAAALIVLIINPLALFTASFQLSFSSVVAIALIYPVLVSRLEQKQPGLAGKLFTYTWAAVCVSIAAMLGSLPFMLFHFNRFSVIGPFMNLLVEPFLCLWSLPVGLIAIPFIFFLPDIAAALLHIGSLGIFAADRITSFGSTLPAASLWTVTPDAWDIFLYFVLLFVWVYASKTTLRRVALSSFSVLFLLFFTRGLWLDIPGKTSEVSFLDIGQGSSSLIRMSGGKTILVDGGSKASAHFDTGERIIAPFLWKKKLWRVDDVIITHPHSDHFNGISYILDHFKPARLLINGDSPESEQYSNLLRSAEEKNISIVIPETGQTLVNEKDARITCISGGEKTGAKTKNAQLPVKDRLTLNDRSLVVKFEHGSMSFLFPGDIGRKVELELVDSAADLRADVLLAPHHGSRGSGSPPFISAIDPELIVVSAGHNGRGQYLYPGHLKKWKKDGRTVLVTSRNGTVTCRTNGNDLQVTTYRENMHEWSPPDISGE